MFKFVAFVKTFSRKLMFFSKSMMIFTVTSWNHFNFIENDISNIRKTSKFLIFKNSKAASWFFRCRFALFNQLFIILSFFIWISFNEIILKIDSFSFISLFHKKLFEFNRLIKSYVSTIFFDCFMLSNVFTRFLINYQLIKRLMSNFNVFSSVMMMFF